MVCAAADWTEASLSLTFLTLSKAWPGLRLPCSLRIDHLQIEQSAMSVVAVAAVARARRRDWKAVEVDLQMHLLYQTWRVVAPVGQTYSAFMHLAGPVQKLVNQISQLQATRSVEQVRQIDLVSRLHPMA